MEVIKHEGALLFPQHIVSQVGKGVYFIQVLLGDFFQNIDLVFAIHFTEPKLEDSYPVRVVLCYFHVIHTIERILTDCNPRKRL